MNQLDYAKANKVTPLMRLIAKDEAISPRAILKNMQNGHLVIPLNKSKHISSPCGIGKGLRTKVNANIGTSTDESDLQDELKKLEVAIQYGADTVMDLSVGGDIPGMRRKIIERSTVPVGTVPVYEVAVNSKNEYNDPLEFSAKDILEILKQQAEDGVDFFTVHSGITARSLGALKKKKRILGIVSRGGAIIAAWMRRHKKENPFFEYFDSILEIAKEFDITLSLGDGLRPGSILDATDPAQLAELKILGSLAKRARKRNVQVMIEGPGHVPLDQVEKNVSLEKKFCHQAPFYVLGPLVTDIASGYDHISGAIGGAIAAGAGADFLCFLTPSEHLRHPSVEDTIEGVIASRIAAHAGDIVKGIKGARDKDKAISVARMERDWQKQIRLALDPEKAARLRNSSKPRTESVCTMCGDYCSIKLNEECLRV
jgi:phosphomethylpyrimidine synthase